MEGNFSEEDYYDDYLENESYEDCPNCSRTYSHIDYDFQSCSKCGWDAEKEIFSKDALIDPDEDDFMNGDADILTGRWY